MHMLDMKEDFIGRISADANKWELLSDANSHIEEPGFYRVPLDSMDLKSAGYKFAADTFLNFEVN